MSAHRLHVTHCVILPNKALSIRNNSSCPDSRQICIYNLCTDNGSQYLSKCHSILKQQHMVRIHKAPMPMICDANSFDSAATARRPRPNQAIDRAAHVQDIGVHKATSLSMRTSGECTLSRDGRWRVLVNPTPSGTGNGNFTERQYFTNSSRSVQQMRYCLALELVSLSQWFWCSVRR